MCFTKKLHFSLICPQDLLPEGCWLPQQRGPPGSPTIASLFIEMIVRADTGVPCLQFKFINCSVPSTSREVSNSAMGFKHLDDTVDTGTFRSLEMDFVHLLLATGTLKRSTWRLTSVKTCAIFGNNNAKIKRLSLKRRPRAAVGDAEKAQSDVSSIQWPSAESSSSDDTRLLGMSSAPKGRPPLPPPHGSTADKNHPRNDGPPVTRSPSMQKQNAVLENLNLEQELASHLQSGSRRRLASFGGVSSPGSLSRFTGLGAYNDPNNSSKLSSTGSDMCGHLGSRGSIGCLQVSPQSSGRSTPVTSPQQLQSVRDQMVVALQKLREMEEQVKIIPVLKVKILVLQEEKKKLASQLKNQNKDTETSTDEGVLIKEKHNCSDFSDLDDEMMALERAIESGHFPAWQGKSHMNDEDSVKEAMENNKARNTELEKEVESQQQIIGALKEKIRHMEAELKESALQVEMSRLKLELQAAEARNRADKASSARPSTASSGTQAGTQTASQGVGNHIQLRDASTGDVIEVKNVAVSCCGPDLKNIGSGSDLPMSHWEVRERVETKEMGAGVHISTSSQGVGVEVKVCDAESNTEASWENPQPKNLKSVACGDCSVNVIVREAKIMVSKGVATDPIKGVSLGLTASSQRSNTSLSSVSRFTNTRHAFNMDSSTNTVLKSQHKHTNTSKAATTRTVSVGSRLKDIKGIPKTRTVGVGTSPLEGYSPKQNTRDIGVGFASIYENFLVGLKTQNMASGPSHLPDPLKTRSIGVGEGRIRDLSGPNSQEVALSQNNSELYGCVEKTPKVLNERGNPLTEAGWIHHNNKQGSNSTLSSNDKGGVQAGGEVHPFDSANRESQAPPKMPADSSNCHQTDSGLTPQGGYDSEVKRMIQLLEQQTSSAMRGEEEEEKLLWSCQQVTICILLLLAEALREVRLLPVHVYSVAIDGSHVQKKKEVISSVLFLDGSHVQKKKEGDQSCSNSRRNMRFMKVTSGLNPVSHDKKEAERGPIRKSPQDVAAARRLKSVTTKATKGSPKSQITKRCKFSEKMLSACQALKTHLNEGKRLPSRELREVQEEWMSVSSSKSASADLVEEFMSNLRMISPWLLRHVVNMADSNGNTALHYSVSHSNFHVVHHLLLDGDVCDINKQNKAGYTPIMLAALAAADQAEDMMVVEHLFDRGDVNAKASQAGQTALMLAVSHSRVDMVRALLARGAKVNLQDDEGSTALMCASEHGHTAMVKLLLDQPDCDAMLQDSDQSTALSIAMETGHHDIAVLLYARTNFSRGLSEDQHSDG
ncbi:KN motif and ankyrin repeat domain-containing protein 1-like [Nerophis lumbriciformis]|uniref:KN motif and ankyrin repeat domain-containing protein 1-like n=1 Tax=Nerophis lumbriciformis TaxID=546530 RepID=UPI003BA86F8F